MKLSIATKLIVVSLFLVAISTLPLAWTTSNHFEKASREREESANLRTAISRGLEVDQFLKALVEKTKTLATLQTSIAQQQNEVLQDVVRKNLMSDRDFFAMDTYQLRDGEMKRELSIVQETLPVDAGDSNHLLERVRNERPFPVSSVMQGTVEIQSATVDPILPLMAVGVPVGRDVLGKINRVAVTYFQLARLQRSFAERTDRRIFLLDARGTVLGHPDESVFLRGEDLSAHPVVVDAMKNRSPRGSLNTEEFHGAYARSVFGPLIVSEISQDLIRRPALEARQQATLITGLILALSILAIFIFSTTLSRPIEKLADLIREVGQGNLDVNAKSQIKTRDEVGVLAGAIDEMVIGLKERAKAYAVMRQALGASVIQTLMSMKEEDMGGKRQSVTVLFSDLRDFTKFSEGHTPEEVVSMLNEYFDVMVRVVSDNGGWLDKFIGDAIMAVWGVPYTGEDDAGRAVKAALQMRLALNELNEKRTARGDHPIKIGVGLHSGEAIVGKIGATDRANLTVIGDTVNLASRIESSTKAFGVDILISEELAIQIDQRFWVQNVGQAEVKGKSQPLRFYKLNGTMDESGEKHSVQTPYSEYQAEAVDKVKVA